jgi:hypothetical protein
MSVRKDQEISLEADKNVALAVLLCSDLPHAREHHADQASAAPITAQVTHVILAETAVSKQRMSGCRSCRDTLTRAAQ